MPIVLSGNFCIDLYLVFNYAIYKFLMCHINMPTNILS